jgi:hypothetical protein
VRRSGSILLAGASVEEIGPSKFMCRVALAILEVSPKRGEGELSSGYLVGYIDALHL